MAGRLYSTLKFRNLALGLQCKRTFLSAAYRCDEAWKERLKSPILARIIPGDYAFELDRKYKREGKVTAIDVDLFINRLEPKVAMDMTQDIEDLLRRLRRSPETINTLPSTQHSALRILLDTRRTKLLLKLLANPLDFGIFPDYYIANLLMDTFIKEKNYTAAARVASILMLQEDFGPHLTQALAIASCYAYIKCADNLPWEEYSMKPEEPVEEVKIRIKYLRNPYFDDHFDIKDPNHIVGKTLAWGASLIGGEIGLNCELLGWALYNKWKQLVDALGRAIDSNVPVASSVMSTVKEIVNSVENNESREEVLSLISRLETDTSKVIELDLESLIHSLVEKAVAETEEADIKAQGEIYMSWAKTREEEVEKQVELYRRKQLVEEIEQKKKYLEAKEQLLTFFENQDRLEMLLDRKPVPPEKDRTHFFPHKIKKKKVVDEDYIPPEI